MHSLRQNELIQLSAQHTFKGALVYKLILLLNFITKLTGKVLIKISWMIYWDDPTLNAKSLVNINTTGNLKPTLSTTKSRENLSRSRNRTKIVRPNSKTTLDFCYLLCHSCQGVTQATRILHEGHANYINIKTELWIKTKRRKFSTVNFLFPLKTFEVKQLHHCFAPGSEIRTIPKQYFLLVSTEHYLKNKIFFTIFIKIIEMNFH